MTDKTCTTSSYLAGLDACPEAIAWAWSHGGDLASLWRDCQRGDWMLWYAAKAGAPRPALVLAAAACAETALPYASEHREVCESAIAAARAWAKAPSDKTRKTARAAASVVNAVATDAAYAPRAVAHAGPRAAAYAAVYAAVAAARSAARSAAYEADYGAYEAYAAGDEAARAAAYAAAREAAYEAYVAASAAAYACCAGIVRRELKVWAREEGLHLDPMGGEL